MTGFQNLKSNRTCVCVSVNERIRNQCMHKLGYAFVCCAFLMREYRVGGGVL